MPIKRSLEAIFPHFAISCSMFVLFYACFMLFAGMPPTDSPPSTDESMKMSDLLLMSSPWHGQIPGNKLGAPLSQKRHQGKRVRFTHSVNERYQAAHPNSFDYENNENRPKFYLGSFSSLPNYQDSGIDTSSSVTTSNGDETLFNKVC